MTIKIKTWKSIWILSTWTQDPFSLISSESSFPDIVEQKGKWEIESKARGRKR